MGVLVDYACAACLGRHEVRVDSPPPAVSPCPACGGAAVRSWSPVGVLRREGAGPPGPAVSPAGAGATSQALCAANPDVPGLCHMSPDAGRMWVARARKDNRAVEHELQRQATRAATGAPLPPLASHGHHHPGVGDHRHEHAHGQ